MQKTNLIILSILIVGGMFIGLSYAATTITDTSITTTNLTVTGTCSGCGNIEGTFTTWSKSLNQTIAGSSGDPVILLLTSADGSVIVQNSNDKVSLIKLDGTVVIVNTAPSSTSNTGETPLAQSISGQYKALLTSSGVNVYKNNSLLTTIGIKTSDFFGANLGTVSVSISPDAKYISIAGKDTGGALNRIIVLTGS